MTRLLTVVGFAFLLSAAAAEAQITKPIRHTWIATSCENWNCAAAELVLADGSPDVIVLPTKSPSRPWLILRRVEEGSLFIPDEEPFACEVFDGMGDASARYSAMDSCHAAILLNVPDGKVTVTSLRSCGDVGKRRAAAPR